MSFDNVPWYGWVIVYVVVMTILGLTVQHTWPPRPKRPTIEKRGGAYVCQLWVDNGGSFGDEMPVGPIGVGHDAKSAYDHWRTQFANSKTHAKYQPIAGF